MILTILLSCFNSNLDKPTSIQKGRVFCEKEFQPILTKIEELPDAAKLIESVLEEGSFRIEKNRHLSKQFEGYWSGEKRTIYLTKTKKIGEGDLISTILFELHNAKAMREFDHLDHLATKRLLNKKGYVRAIEHLEYRNARLTSAILNAGIEKGLFPKSCYWPLDANFESHLAIQENMGHSNWIGQMYEELFM